MSCAESRLLSQLALIRHQSWVLRKMIITKIQKSSSRFDFSVPAWNWTSESPLSESFSSWKWTHQLTRSKFNMQCNLHVCPAVSNRSSTYELVQSVSLSWLIVLWDSDANIYLHLISPVIQSLPIIYFNWALAKRTAWDLAVFAVFTMRVEGWGGREGGGRRMIYTEQFSTGEDVIIN